MELYVYDIEFNRLGIVDMFDCVLIENNYKKEDTLELQISGADKEIYNLLSDGNVLYRDISVEKPVPFIIESSEINEVTETKEGMFTFTVSASSAEKILERRITGYKESYSGVSSEVLKKYINSNVISPENFKRKIKEIELVILSDTTDKIDMIEDNKNLFDVVKDILDNSELGISSYTDFEQKKFIIEIYEGKDRTSGNGSNTEAIFSAEFENIQNEIYRYDSSEMKNHVLVSGENDENRKTVTVFENTEPEGIERREMYISSGISDKDSDNQEIPEEEYLNLLKTKGKETLSDSRADVEYNCDLIDNEGLKFRRDYDIGDKVSIFNRNLGIDVSERIISIEESFDSDGFSMNAKIGTNNVSILKKLL